MLFRAGWLLLLWPLFRFLSAKRYRPPRKVRVPEPPGRGHMLMEPDFAFYISEKGPVAVSRRCTHLGCIINYDERGECFICPCHQSRFTKEGRYMAGPAKRDLPVYEVMSLPDKRGYLVLVT